MPQPANITATADELIGLFAAAQHDIEHQLAAITDGRRAARLRELQRTITAHLAQLEVDARTWIEQQLPLIYASGANTAAAVIGDSFVWTQVHVTALNELALRAWDDILAATRFVGRDVKAWLRDQARQQATLSLIEGRTATQAAKALADAAGNKLGVFTVMYKDGARHRVSDWADSSIRAVTADMYNTGTINQSREAGVRFMECADGFDCGLYGHDDSEKPNGKLYPINVAAGATLSHPRCRRSWIPRVDASSAHARPLRTNAQIADQAASELARSSRVARSARQPRVARAS